MKLHMTELHFWNNIFCTQTEKNNCKWGQKCFVLNLLKSLVIAFFWICFIIKIYITWRVPTQILCLQNIWFAIYGTKCYQGIRLQKFYFSYIIRTVCCNSLIFCILIQTQENPKMIDFFLEGSWSTVIIGNGQAGQETLELDISQEWIEGINWFFAC